MYAIMGATGQTGGATLRALQARGARVRAISRDAAAARAALGPQVEVVEADPMDTAALARAFTGARGVYVLNTPALDAEDAIAAAAAVSASIAAALAEARPSHVAALSSEGAHLAEGTGVIAELRDFETALGATGLPLTRLRATYFMENWASVIAPARDAGVLPSFLAPFDRPQRMVAAADIGAAAAEALLAPPPAETRTINLAGPRDYTVLEAAEAFAEALGRPVTAVAPPRADWEAALVAAGLGASYAAALAAMYDGINTGVIQWEPGVGALRRGQVEFSTVLRGLAA